MKWFSDLFPALFFASATTFVDGGGDVDPSGGAADTAEAVESAAEEVPADSESVEAADGDAEPQEPKEAVEHNDGKPITAEEIKKGLAELRKTNPRLAEALRKEYYGAGDYKQVYPNVQAAREARDLIDEIGGREGFDTLKGEADSYAKELAAMASGDTSVVDSLVNDFPQALPKLAPYAVDKWRQVDEAGYERFAAGIVGSTLRDKGVEHLALRLQELIIDGKQPAAAELAGKLRDWIGGVSDFARTQPQRTDEHPDVVRARQEREQIERERATEFRGKVATSVIRSMDTEISRLVDPMIRDKKLKLTANQRVGIINEARSLLSKEFEGLKPYQDKMKSLMAQGDLRAIERYLGSQLTRDRVNKAVKEAWGSRGFSVARPQTTAGNGAATVKLNTKPRAEQIDWEADPRRERYQRGEATLKKEYGGKVVKWDWDAVAY